MFCTNTGKKTILLVLALLLIALLTGHASAYTSPYKLMVFTDKQVYLDYAYLWTEPPTIDTTPGTDTRGTFDQKVNLFVALLDSDGNIVKGIPASNISAALRDKERWNHSGPGLNNYPFYTAITTNGQYYNNITFPVFTDPDGDGIFNSTNNVIDTMTLSSMPPLTDQLNISINVTLRYSGITYATNVSVIFGNMGCRHDRTIGTAHTSSQHDNTVCTVCHWGYQYELGSHGPNNTIMNDDLERWKGIPPGVGDSSTWDYKLGTRTTTLRNQTTWDNSNASYCLMCHGGTKTATSGPYKITEVLDIFSPAATGVAADQNDDLISDMNRPSCSWYQGPKNGTTGGYPICHGSQVGSNGSTKITGSQLFNIEWAGSSNGPGTSKSHNHSSSPRTNGAPCEFCHAGGGASGTGTGGMHMVAGLPNRTSDHSNINDQCMGCHNTTDGWLNLTSNGGTAKNHSKTNQCGNCHIDNNKLDPHNVPTGAYGGKWCLNCHNLTGKAPIDMRVDPVIVNVSNTGYTHYILNKRSDASNSSRICWGCHTNNSIVRNGAVNSSGLSSDEHPDGFDAPRTCTSCHNNTNASLSFGAPQTYRHTWYAPDMKTPVITYCTSCHAQEEMLINWDESVYPPKTENESASHYGRNRTSSFPPVGSREYCGYCHQNESTVMGPFANPNNEVRSDHASQNTTPSCGDEICHKPGRMHEDELVVPVYNESNIDTTCLACHTPVNYSFHNSTISCWDCHMGNVSNTTSTWIHPIQFIQYNGNFTGAKLTSATCYDCHKSTTVDSILQNLSGKTSPKVYDQAHSNDAGNGTKWGDYWKYTPTTYNFASYYVGTGVIDPAHPFDNIRVPGNDFMELIENHTGSSNIPVRFPYTKAERNIEGPPVPNWTSNTKVTAGTTTLTSVQDGTEGDPAGSLKAMLKTRSSSGSGSVSWNYSFYYKPDLRDYAYTRVSVNYNVTVSSALTQNVYLRLIKPGGAVVTLAGASHSSNTGWLTLSNNSFADALDEDGSVTPYIIQLHTELSGTGTKNVQNPYTVYFDNILMEFQEKVWNRYEIIINTTGVPVNGSSKLGMSYQVHIENAYLQIYNRTSAVYEQLDLLDKGVFFDYVKDINSKHHIDSKNGITGNVSVRFVDTNQNDTDAVTDKLHIRYLYVFTDRGLQYPCEQCHSPNKHYVYPTIGSPEKFRAGNSYNNSDLDNSTWCQQCHWDKAAGYTKMIQEFSVTRNPPENIPPEITGNKTYGNFTTSKDGKTAYINHTGSAYNDMNDSGCFKCHGKSGDITTTQFIHNVQVGQSGNRECVTCHNANSTNYRKADVEAVRRGMHGGLKNASAIVGNTSDPVELACWACHGDGVYNDPDQHRNTNAWTCDKCHTNTSVKLNYSAPQVFQHIPPGSVMPEANITTRFNYTTWACADCHNNSINYTALTIDFENDQNDARAGHYGLNRTAGRLMYDFSTPPKGNSQDCNYCHKGNSTNMTKWGVNITSTMNLNNKVSPTDHTAKTNSECGSCHNYSSTQDFTFHAPEINEGAGASGHNCRSCHDVGGSAGAGMLVNFTAMNETSAIHRDLNRGAEASDNSFNDSKKCWACHDDGAQPSGHNDSRYKTPYICDDCHTQSGILSGKYPGWNVTEHVKAGSVNGTELFTPLSDNCYSCHNISEMMINGADPDGKSVNIYEGINGGSNSTSHYGKKRNLGTADAYCNYCHNNATTVFVFNEQHNKRIFEHTGNSTADVRNATTMECIDCHATNPQSYRIHNSTLYTPQVSEWTAGKQDRCAPCHLSGSSGSNMKVNNSYHNTTTGNITDCSYCHNSDSMRSSAPQNVHSDNLSKGGNSSYNNCYNCHQNGFTSLIIIEHTNKTNANITNPSMTCEKIGCHNSNRTHSKLLIKPATSIWTPGGNDYCAPCHNFSDSANNATKKIYNMGHDPAGSTKDNITSCANCHNTSTPGAVPSSFRLHDAPSTNLSGKNESTCGGCHNGTIAYVGQRKLMLSHIPNASQYRGNTSESGYSCELCHNMTGKISMHSAGMERTNGTCDTCHFNNTSPFKSLTKNITKLAGGMVNHTYDGRDRKTCNTTMCHNASGRVKFHLSKYAVGDIADPQDSAGAPTFIDRATWSGDINDRGILVDCRDCHEKYNDTAPFFAPFQEANVSGENLQEHVGKGYKLTNCYVCHTAEDNVSKSATMHNISIEPLTGGPACKKCHDIASVNRTLDNKLWMNVTAFNSTNSVHRNFINATLWNGSKVFEREDTACWVCHQSDGKQPERHTDKNDEAYKAYKCADCHTTEGNVSIYQPQVYNNALKISKNYPGSVFLGTMIFTDAVSCSMCHKNSLVANTNIIGYPNPSKADDIDSSHYGTRSDLINTSLNLKGCQRCHGVGVDGQDTMDYGNAGKVPEGHNDMGSTPVDCETSCHNSAVDMNNLSIPVDLHNNSVGIYVGEGACNAPGCHTPPAPPDEGTR